MIKKCIKQECVFLIAILFAFCGCGQEKTVQKHQVETKAEEKRNDENIEYTDCTVMQLAQELAKNAFRAKNKYIDKHLRLSGKIDRINSDGRYIILTVHDVGMYASVQCNLTQEEQKDALMGLNVGDDIKILGKITGVGDVAEYSFDIDEFIATIQ